MESLDNEMVENKENTENSEMTGENTTGAVEEDSANPEEGAAAEGSANPEEGVAAEGSANPEEGATPATPETSETPEQDKTQRSNRIKIAIVAIGGVFILFAAVYAAAVMGGKTRKIPTAMQDTIPDAPTEEAKPAVTTASGKQAITPIVGEEEEEMPDESLIGIVQGNARYDECIYADGGVVVVRKGEMYGAIDYEGKEITPLNYKEAIQLPTAKGNFVLANTKIESVTEEKDGATLAYDKETTTYTLFDNKGKKLYEGNGEVVSSGSIYTVAIEDASDVRNNRVEYYKTDAAGKPFMVIYVKDSLAVNGFKDGKTIVYGFTAPPAENQDTNPTNLVCGIMDETGKVTWFAKAPGMDEFDKLVAKWKEDNKVMKTTNAKKTKKKKEKDVVKEVEEENSDTDAENTDEENTDEEVDEEEEEETEELTDEELEEIELTDEELEDIEQEVDLSAGPIFHMDEVLNSPSEGYFVTKDIYDVVDPFSFYDEKGTWVADLDTSYMNPDAKKGFVIGNLNNGAVTVSKYVHNGEYYWNYGACMVLNVGNKDVLVDVSKAVGMTSENVTDKIVRAVYDDISLSESEFWMYKEGNKCGYIDHSGLAQKPTYDDASDFSGGYALVVKGGKAYIINEKFEELEEIGAASSVATAGDLMMVMRDGGVRYYMLKDNRDDPLGEKKAKDEDPQSAKNTPSADAKDAKAADAKATPASGKKK